MKTPLKEHIIFSLPGKKITVPIYIGKDSFDNIKSVVSLNKYSSILIITDENVAHHWTDKIHRTIGEGAYYQTIPAGEKNKSLSNVEKIWTILSKKGFDRKSLIINIGGGMVCDIGAFAASTFMRGISFIQVPTSLLAMADASIGGKTGFNFNGLKNTIGTFSVPLAVLSDTSFLSSLPPREFRSGFAEIIKHAIIVNTNFWDYLLSMNLISPKENELDKILSLSSNIKCEIVRNDPYEKNERKKLNFGHTIGHAVEMSCHDSSKPLLHGEAVAIGIIAESRMSFLSGYLSEAKFRDIENLIVKFKLPNKISSSHKEGILTKIKFDKKNSSQKIKWVFLEDIGNVKVDVTLPDDIVLEGLNYILE
jgi:3-dehydroquinate synthase